jgi:hypothetical protein
MFPGIDLTQASADGLRNHYPAVHGRAIAPNRRINVQLQNYIE